MSNESAIDAPGMPVGVKVSRTPLFVDFEEWEQHPYTQALRQAMEAKLNGIEQKTQQPLEEAQTKIARLSEALSQIAQERDATRRALDQQMRIAVQLSERITELQERIRVQP